MEGYWLFLALLGSALLLGFVSVLFALVWVLHYREGLAWNGGAAEFNWHPVLIITGFVFVQGIVGFVVLAAGIQSQPLIATEFCLVLGFIAIIVYRLPWTWKCSKLLMKLIHAGLNTIALILAIIALVAAFDFHNHKAIPNMYSLHSWIGLTAVILFALQLVLGFAVFLLPFAPVSLRATVLPIHVFSGLVLFGTVIATALMGLTEKLIFALSPGNYSRLPEEGAFVNTLGVLIVVFGGVILWMATRPHWKRPPEQNTKSRQRNGGMLDGNEEGSTMTDGSNTDKSDVEFNSEASARKRSPKLDEAGQRSTM